MLASDPNQRPEANEIFTYIQKIKSKLEVQEKNK